MFVAFFLFWIVLNGRMTAELALFGVGIAAAMWLFLRYAFGWNLARERRLIRNLPFAVLYLLNLVREIVKSALLTARVVLGGKKPDPVIVEFRSGFSSRAANVILANSITLTPGTYTIFEKGGRFAVHCLCAEFGEGLDSSSFVKLLRRMDFGKKEARA